MDFFPAMRAYADSGATRSFAFRQQQLKTLRKAIKASERQIMAALHADLHKSPEEAYTTEIGFIYAEISHTLKHLRSWMAPKRVGTPLALFPSASEVRREPLGVCLIIAPWNYPFQLLMAPLVGAIAGGNAAVLKPSEMAPATSAVIKTMIAAHFPPEYITVVEGEGAGVVPALMQQHRFDHVFFTGSVPAGRAVAQLAASQLVPVTLELGGKSPCVVHPSADLAVAAKRITWGKFTNAGQTCVAPDFLVVHRDVKAPLMEGIKQCIRQFYGEDPRQSADYGRIINKRRFDVLLSYVSSAPVIFGGTYDAAERYLAPTLVEAPEADSPLMQEEIFGPILPILEYSTEAELHALLKQYPDPLSFYVFSNDTRFSERLVSTMRFGGGCINNTLVHLANADLPFGGLGNSGSGQYHGQYSFETFTRPKALVQSATWFDPPLKYPPYRGKLKWFRWLLR